MEKISKMTNINDLPSTKQYQSLIRQYNQKFCDLRYELFSIDLCLGGDLEELMNKKRIYKDGKCTCSEQYDGSDITNDEIQEEREEMFNSTNFDPNTQQEVKLAAYNKLTHNKVLKRIIEGKKCIRCNKYNLDECKYCQDHPISTIIMFPGSIPQAQKRKNEIIALMIDLNKNIVQYKNLVSLIEFMEKKLETEKNPEQTEEDFISDSEESIPKVSISKKKPINRKHIIEDFGSDSD